VKSRGNETQTEKANLCGEKKDLWFGGGRGIYKGRGQGGPLHYSGGGKKKETSKKKGWSPPEILSKETRRVHHLSDKKKQGLKKGGVLA